MDSNKVDAFIISNSNRLPESQISLIRETLLSTDESKTFSITLNTSHRRYSL